MSARGARSRDIAALPPISLRELNRATLARQGLLERLSSPIPDAVERVGGLQAQHPDWPRVALWARLDGIAPGDTRASLERREVVRATLMRRTVHVASARDYWPIALFVQASFAEAWRLGFREDPHDPAVMERLRPAHEAAFEALAARPSTGTELTEVMAAAVPQVVSDRPRSYLFFHFLAHVPLVIVPVDAERYGRSFYAASTEWLGDPPGWASEPAAALAYVAERYLAAFGPASVEDFTSYLGRRGSLAERREAIDSLAERLVRFQSEDGRELVDLVDAPRPPGDMPAHARFLARWDSALLSHESKQRTRILPEPYRSTVITNNGDVLPTFLVDGFVAGSWRVSEARGESTLTLRPFQKIRAADRRTLEEEGERLGAFLAPEASRRALRWENE